MPSNAGMANRRGGRRLAVRSSLRHQLTLWLGLAWPGLAWPGLARPGPAWPGLAWPRLAPPRFRAVNPSFVVWCLDIGVSPLFVFYYLDD